MQLTIIQLPCVQEAGKLAQFTTPMGELYTVFYEKLFIANPEVKPLFKQSLQVQGRKLVSMLSAIVRLAKAGEIDELKAACEKLGERHVGYNVALVHFHTVGQVLLATLEQCLGEQYTPEVHTAWLNTFCVLMKFIMPAHKAAVARASKAKRNTGRAVQPAAAPSAAAGMLESSVRGSAANPRSQAGAGGNADTTSRPSTQGAA